MVTHLGWRSEIRYFSSHKIFYSSPPESQRLPVYILVNRNIEVETTRSNRHEINFKLDRTVIYSQS